ncbi:hypothetical protein ANN_13253 [Periplaneta americana]|uniref:Uncharacterized protein n=1 Tax=Periplaneta americana TaxID=6978 RepID=A0ABQ8TKA1_PERAM|nr:hypothetical protein ANN_13253 [Periplaneta americana]
MVVLYGCETWTLTLREEQRLRVFENKVLRKIFGAKRDEVTGEWRKLHNSELHALYSSSDIIRNIKFRHLRWAGHVAHMGESRNAYRVAETEDLLPVFEFAQDEQEREDGVCQSFPTGQPVTSSAFPLRAELVEQVREGKQLASPLRERLVSKQLNKLLTPLYEKIGSVFPFTTAIPIRQYAAPCYSDTDDGKKHKSNLRE